MGLAEQKILSVVSIGDFALPQRMLQAFRGTHFCLTAIGNLRNLLHNLLAREPSIMLRILAAIGFSIFATSAAAQECREIRFSAGSSSGEVAGKVIEGHPMCFTFGSGAGQIARLQLFGSDNACFTIDGVVDCQDEYRLRTSNTTYRVGVYQLFPRMEPEAVTLRLTIR